MVMMMIGITSDKSVAILHSSVLVLISTRYEIAQSVYLLTRIQAGVPRNRLSISCAGKRYVLSSKR
jgi:hypothetical protein